MGRALTLALGVILTSCANSSGDGRGVPDAGSRTYARLSVVVTVAREGVGDGGGSVGTSARLLRYRGVDLESAQILAGAPDATRGAGAAPGGCQVVDTDALLDDALATSPPDASVQMLDAGDLLVHVAGQTVKVSPRYVPEIIPFVSGVVYEAEAQAVDPMAEVGRDEAFVAAFGGQQLGRFVAPAEMPAPARIMSVDEGQGDLTVSWTRADAAAAGPIAIVLAGGVGTSLRCLAPDTGRFTLPAELLGRVREAAGGTELVLSVERTRSLPFSAPGLDQADVEITVRDALTIR
jgi:hypothetical protein